MCRATFGGRRACYHLAPSEVSERLTFSFGERDTHSEAMHVVVICVTIVSEGCMATSKHRRAMQVRTQSGVQTMQDTSRSSSGDADRSCFEAVLLAVVLFSMVCPRPHISLVIVSASCRGRRCCWMFQRTPHKLGGGRRIWLTTSISCPLGFVAVQTTPPPTTSTYARSRTPDNLDIVTHVDAMIAPPHR